LLQACGDFVIRRSDGIFAYQLAVVVDDAAMGIDRILRGADLLSSTSRQIYLWRLLGVKPPAFLHVPLLVGSDGRRLSKRHGSLAIAALRDTGVKSEEIIGRLAAWAGLIGRAEPVKAQELIQLFEISRLPRDPVIVAEPLDFE
jgi:glutamyl-tRNA synthetase